MSEVEVEEDEDGDKVEDEDEYEDGFLDNKKQGGHMTALDPRGGSNCPWLDPRVGLM